MAELVWEGKYRDGRRALPDRAPRALLTDEVAGLSDTQSAATGQEEAWRNRLIQGDTRDVLPALLPELAGRVSFVYMDPPFATGADQKIAIPLPRGGPGGASSQPSIERIAFHDTWGPGLDGYLQWFFETVTLLRELLAEDGAIVVHCDWRADAPLRLILDEVFGAANFRNAIAWAYRSGGASRRESLARKHDTLLLYARSPRFAIRPQIERQYLRKPFIGSRRDAAGRHYVDTLLRDVLDGELTLGRGDQLVQRSLRPVLNVSRERLGYPTQKPLGLIELLIEVASDPGDLVLDCCCGSGTTPAAAAIAGRRWIAADSSPFALAATRARLLDLPAARPFAVQRVVTPDGDKSLAQNASGATLHVSAQITPCPDVARPVSLFAMAGDDESYIGADGGGFRQATAGGIWHAPTAADERFTEPSHPPASTSSVYSVTLALDGLTLPDRDLPAGVVPPNASSGSAWIAYWLVDWEYGGEVFRIREWSNRPRGASARAPTPTSTLRHTYAHPGRRTIAVRAIDLLGGVTIATLDVDL